jgi:hypothetical protein
MILSLSDAPGFILGRLAADPVLAPIPRIQQIDPQYNQHYEAALQSPGVAFITWFTDGQPAENADCHQLDLDNVLVLAVVENPTKNTSGKSAFEWVKALLVRLHQLGLPATGGPKPVKLDQPAYTLGPLRTGLVVYFIKLRVRTVDALVPPPAP